MRQSMGLVSFLIIYSFIGCSQQSIYSSQAALGSLLGGTVGAGLGYVIGDEYGIEKEGALVGGISGGGLGLLAGGLMYDTMQIDRDEIVVRKALPVSQTQRDIDALRGEINDSSNWGGNETRPWNERYMGENPNRPYQGPASPTFR